MASRTIFRRILQASRHVHIPRAAVQRCIVTLPQLQKKSDVTTENSYSQLRHLCTKAGEGLVFHIQDENDFNERVLNSSLPVVVDFHASWCGPCKLLGPRLESLVGSRNGKVVLAKCDVDEVEEIAMKYRISSVPTVIGFKNKQSKDKFIGLQDDDIIETFLDKLIG